METKVAQWSALMSHTPTFTYSRKKHKLHPLHNEINCFAATVWKNTIPLYNASIFYEENVWRNKEEIAFLFIFIHSFLVTSRFLSIFRHLSLGSWNLIYVFPLAFLLSPSSPGMPESSALPSVWSRVSADLQQIVYFSRHRGNMDGPFIGSRFTAELQPGSSVMCI